MEAVYVAEYSIRHGLKAEVIVQRNELPEYSPRFHSE